MKRLFSPGITSTFTFILSILAILVVAVSAPGMVQAVLGPAATPGDIQPGSSIMASGDKMPGLNPAVQIGTLADTGIFGTVGIGTASPVSPLHIYSTSSTQPETIDLDGAQPITAQWNDYCPTGGAFSGSGFLARFAHGSKASPANVTNGDRLGFNVFGGWAGTGFKHTGAIEAIVDTGTVSDTSLPTYMRFSTTPNGSALRLERMRITADGNVGIGTASPDSLARLHVVNSDATLGAAAIFGQETAGGGADTAGVLGRYGPGTVLTGTGTKGMLGTVGAGVYGYNEVSHNNGWIGGANEGVWGHNNNGNYGKLGTTNEGVYGRSGDTGPYGQLGTATEGVYGNSGIGSGVSGHSQSSNGVHGSSQYGYGVRGESDESYGVYGTTTAGGAGVRGDSDSYGVYGYSASGSGVYGHSSSGIGVHGHSDNGYAGRFDGYTYVSGNLTVTGDLHFNGTMTGGTKSFKIDHPQDPENKYLQHSVVESPEIKNIYDGTIQLDCNGEATIELPSYFESLNRDFRYQLTCIGGYAPVYVAEKIADNHFKIAGGKAGLEVSWQVTGVRQDAYAKAHPIVVEQEKPADEVGFYLHPMEWGQPESKGIAQLHKPAGAPTLAKAE